MGKGGKGEKAVAEVGEEKKGGQQLTIYLLLKNNFELAKILYGIKEIIPFFLHLSPVLHQTWANPATPLLIRKSF